MFYSTWALRDAASPHFLQRLTSVPSAIFVFFTARDLEQKSPSMYILQGTTSAKDVAGTLFVARGSSVMR